MNDPKFKVVELDALKVEEGAQELFDSPDMQPYVRLLEAVVLGGDVAPALGDISRIPLEKRYLWRVASALKAGFADFDTVNVDADRQTLPPADLAKVLDLLKLRPAQLCMLASHLVGPEEMRRIMERAIRIAERE